jgi:type II secretory pathway pseudopilin PulG
MNKRGNEMNRKFISPATKIAGWMKGKLNFKKKFGQVWIETVIYTLIAFVMIGLVLSYAQPKIQEMQDQSILQQSTTMLKQIDTTISTMGTSGNQRVMEIVIKAGMMKIDGVEDKIIFQMDTKNKYSEPDKVIYDGDVQILTVKKSGYNTVTLTIPYSETYNLQFEGRNEVKTVSKSATAYRLSISNDGADSNGKIILNMTLQ